MQLSSFERSLEDFCKISQYSIALPESRDPRIIEAVCHFLQAKSVDTLYLFIEKAEFKALAKKAKILLPPMEEKIVFLPQQDRTIEEKTFHHISEVFDKKQKKIRLDDVRDLAKEPLYQAGYLVAAGKVHAAIAGAVHTTSEVIRAGLVSVGCAAGIKTVSGSFLMLKDEPAQPSQVYLYADCGVVVDPSSEQLADIAAASVMTWQSIFGKDQPPVVAFLSFSTKGSASHVMIDKVIAAVEAFRQNQPGVICDGEMQFDAAFDVEIGKRKAPGSMVAGKANIFIFPNLDAGNIAYKISQRLGGFQAYGPILQGLAKPYSDLSRGASVKDIVVSTYINLRRTHKL